MQNAIAKKNFTNYKQLKDYCITERQRILVTNRGVFTKGKFGSVIFL